jgi:hypothetical protein
MKLDQLEQKLRPYGYERDESQEPLIVFWKQIEHEDVKNSYAFSLVLISLDEHSLRIEGLNEPRLRKAIRAGLIQINSAEDVEQLKEVVFETTLDQVERLDGILPFLHQQLQTLQEAELNSPSYQKALANIELLVEAANAID